MPSFFFIFSLPHRGGCPPKWWDVDFLRESLRQLPVSGGRRDLLQIALSLHFYFFFFFSYFCFLIIIFWRLWIESQIWSSPESNDRSSSQFRIVLSAVPFEQVTAMSTPRKIGCDFWFRTAMDLSVPELRVSGKKINDKSNFKDKKITFFFFFFGF